MKETKFKQTLVQTKEGSRHCEEHSDVPIQGGFKMTELGMIPSDWEVKTIKDLGVFLGGGTPSTKNESFWKGSIPWISSADLNDDDIEHISTTRFITQEAVNCSATQICPQGTILIIARVGVGKLALSQQKVCTSQDFCNLIPSKENDSKFLAYALLPVMKQMANESQGTSIKGVAVDEIKKVQIIVPSSKAEQQRIANALSDVDTLIANLEKLIAKKKNIKQGTMQELLTGKKRLPGFAKSNNTKMTELGEIPEDWEVKTLSEIFEFKPNNTFTRDCLNDSKGEYQNVHYGDVLIKYSSILDCSKESIPFINEGINVKFSKYGIMEGDIIIADTAEDETVGKVVEILNLGEKKIVSGLHTFLCRKITDDFAPKWLGYFMNQAIFHNQLLPFITGTKVSAISRTAIQKVKVLIPSKEEQTAIANVLSSIDKEIETLNTKLEKYRNLKTAMMQQLLTGKIRLVK